MATQTTQFCVALENRPGMLAALCRALNSGGVNIEAIFVSGDEEYCWTNFVATPAETAETILTNNQYHFFKERVLTVQLPNQPGMLERVASDLAAAGVNINYVYGGGLDGAPFTLVLNVSDLESASRVLQRAT